MSEALLRIEHKLDVIINYLHGMTSVPPADMPKPLPKAGGLTNGLCPITNTPIYYLVDPATGGVARKSGLTSGMPTLNLGIPNPPSWDQTALEEGVSDGDD